ncbi:hypothetical protein QBC37DRAFT_405760 [Rhypophila decipiens]|uniref:Uncharacterized protein n=1 Tax=Rhypophila decipiens TaxID=261697 RepID=A0AAN6XWJ3_9PEZI|nr:hypothetical protein QBC37DRAFT_405760 [Rhypophila decipiens]
MGRVESSSLKKSHHRRHAVTGRFLRPPREQTVLLKKLLPRHALGVQNATQMKKKDVEPLVATIFTAAKAFLENPATPAILHPPPALQATISALSTDPGTGGGASLGPLSFLFGLRGFLLGKLPGNQFVGVPANSASSVSWLRKISFAVFAALFLVLRSARLRWHKDPRLSLSVDEPSALPRAIDDFNAVAERIEWGGMEMVLWLRDSEMWVDHRSEDEKDSAGAEKSSGKVFTEDGEEVIGVEELNRPKPAVSYKDMKAIIHMMEDLSLTLTWEFPASGEEEEDDEDDVIS